jgi:hypothetical protein
MNVPISAEALLAKIKALPSERLGQVADFVDFLVAPERRSQAGQELREMWARMPQEELTPEIEQQIVDEVRAVRAERRRRNAT